MQGLWKLRDYVVTYSRCFSPKWHLGIHMVFIERIHPAQNLSRIQIIRFQLFICFQIAIMNGRQKSNSCDRGNFPDLRCQSLWVQEHVTTKHEAVFRSGNKEGDWRIVEIGHPSRKTTSGILLTDIKYILGIIPGLPVFSSPTKNISLMITIQEWVENCWGHL